jgi:hypothetical protein
MRNNLTWFDRDSDAHRHPKFTILRMVHGWAAEGRFWALNGMIAESDDCILRYSSSRDKLAIMAELGFPAMQELELFMDYLLSEDCQLIYITEGGITNDRLQDALSKASKKRVGTRERMRSQREIKSGTPKTPENGEISTCDASQSQSNASQVENHASQLTQYSTVQNSTEENSKKENKDSSGEEPLPPAKSLIDKIAEMGKRKTAFGLSLQPFVEEFTRPMVNDFFNYWTEPTKSQIKMRYELERTWSIKGRLSIWRKNGDKFDGGKAIKQQQEQPLTPNEQKLLNKY